MCDTKLQIDENKILVDLKAKPFIEKDDYYQMKRYLEALNLELGLIVNFRDKLLKPKRILNSKIKPFVDSDTFVVSDRKGQVLIEAMVAMSVATVGLLGAFTLLSFSLRLNRDINDKFIAVNLATEGIEIVKNLIRHNVILAIPWWAGGCLSPDSHEMDWDEDGGEGGSSQCPFEDKYLKFDPDKGLYSYDNNGTPSKYKRKINIAWYCQGVICEPSGDPNEIKVNAIVSRSGIGGAKNEINLEDHFFNWLTQCNDGIDNDGNGLTDQQGDPLLNGCSASNDPFEG